MIEIENVTKYYEKFRAVDGVSLNVEAGEAVVLLGSNGAGKSTLIKCVLGTLEFNGHISVDGKDVKKSPKAVRSLIGYVPQEPVFYDMSVQEILHFFGSIRRVKADRISELLDVVGLNEHAEKPASALSGGMKQRLSFAIANLTDAPVLILDEPTSNLDAIARSEFLRLVKKLKDEGKTVLFSSHRLDEVEYLADRVIVMKDGRVILETKPSSMREDLNLRIKLHISVPSSSVDRSRDILSRMGILEFERNGSAFSIEVRQNEKMRILEALISEQVTVLDFSVEETAMEHAMNALNSRDSKRD